MKKDIPKRIAIIGLPGSGKSTFATTLGKLLDIPVHHLDKHVFIESGKKRDLWEFMSIQQKLVDGKSWIIEGCSLSTLEMRFVRSDAVIYLCFPRFFCMWRVFKRLFTLDHNFKTGCAKTISWRLLKYIWNFDKDKNAKIEKLKNQYPNVDFYVFQSYREAKKFLEI